MKRINTKNTRAKAVSLALVLILTAFTLMMSGCATDTATKSTSNDTTGSVEWEYVSPSDLNGDTAKADENADAAADENGQALGSEAPNGQPPEKPDGDMSASGNEQPPEMPNGQAPSGQPPEKPDGDMSASGNEQPPEMPNGEAPSGQPPEMPNGQAPSGMPGQGGPNTQSYDYNGDVSGKLTADGEEVTSDGEIIESTTADENVLLAENGGVLKVTNATINKSGDDNNGDTSNFYGINSSVLAKGEGSEVYLSDSKISSTGEGSNGVFATDSGTAYLKGVEITTTEGASSRGLDATYGGVIYANDMTISTEKDHCASLATDRGGGYISVTNSSLATAGSGSPLIYSTGDIEVDNVTGTATGSQIAGIEGKNRIVINNSTLESTNDNTSGSDPIKDGVILYQSMSGDADTASTETCEFEAVDSTLKTSISDGAMFYVTNTSAEVVLQNTTLDFDSENVQLINAAGNSSNGWGTEGKNGGTVKFTAIDETMSGNIYTDSISSVDMYLTEGSEWTGVSEGENNLNVTVDGTSTWVVTADTTVADLNAADGAKIIDADGKTVTIKADGKTVVEGDSSITVTVTGEYGTEQTEQTEQTSQPALDTKVLDRTAFDEYYGTSTQFGTNK